VILLTIVLSKIEALGTRKETGPDLGIECVGDGLRSLILAVLSYRRELKKVSTCDDLRLVPSLNGTYL
jgi:hypothetical protein